VCVVTILRRASCSPKFFGNMTWHVKKFVTNFVPRMVVYISSPSFSTTLWSYS
jgi:hypothetical protein